MYSRGEFVRQQIVRSEVLIHQGFSEVCLYDNTGTYCNS
jgi:hypothetical protein